MILQATGLVSYTHYPHDDTYTTGERGAALLFATLRGDVRPVMAMSSVPLIPVGSNGMTFGEYPMAYLTNRARELEQHSGILSVSCCAVHPNNDQPDQSSTAVVITDDDPDLAAETARSLAEEFWERRHGFIPDILPVADAVEKGRAIEGPVLLVDTADCAGGGAPADSVALLRELIELGVTERTYVMVVDSVAAAACAEAGIGQTVSFDLGYHVDPTWGTPLPVSGIVRLVCDGRFLYTGGIYGGTYGMMGLSAVLEIGSIDVLVMSRPTYDWADEQYRSVGMDARQAKFIGVKNPMNYRYAYSDVAKASYIVDTPGPTPADIRHLPFKCRKRPFFPLDEDIEDLEFPITINR
jgi:microcystin degradation protein MlrC